MVNDNLGSKVISGKSVSKICRFDGGVCSSDSCDSLSGMGEVVLCSRYRWGFGGRDTPKFIVHSNASVYNKHRSRRG